MTQTQVVQLLTQLDTFDLQGLRKYLKSPFFNHRTDVVDLFEFIVFALHKQPKILTREQAWENTYPGTEFDDQQLRLVTSYLHRLVEDFLAQAQHQASEYARKLNRVKAYHELNLDKPYQRSLKKAWTTLETQPFRNDQYLKDRFETLLENYRYISSRKRSQEANTTLQKSIDAFDQYFIATKLKHACLVLSNQQIFKDDYHIHFLEEAIQHIADHPKLLQQPAISIYYYCFLTITSQEDERHFEQLREQIDLHAHRFSASEIRDLYLMLLNYCTRRMNKGSIKYARMSFDLYRAGVEERYLFENNLLSAASFSNIVFIAITLKEFKWAFHFIQDFRQFLPAKDRNNTYFLTLASLKYHQRDFDQARDLLNNFHSKDPLFILKVRTLQTRIYYELNEVELLESHLSSMNTFLRRKEVAAHLKIPYQEFIKLTRKLVRLSRYDSKQKQSLRLEIDQMRVRSLKSWLLSQLDKIA